MNGLLSPHSKELDIKSDKWLLKSGFKDKGTNLKNYKLLATLGKSS
jgi:hypothetical protein